MSAIGRIFLVLNLILAAVFLGWASTSLATTADYKKKFEDKSTELTNLQALMDKDKAQLQAELGTLRSNLADAMDQRDQQKGLADRNKSDLDAARRQNDQLVADLAAIKSTLESYNATNASMNEQKDRAVQAARDAEGQRDTAQREKDAAEVARRDAQEQLRRAEATIADLERKLTETSKSLSAETARLEAMRELTGVSYNEIQAPPLIEGAVLQIDYSVAPGLLALNVGSDQGVKRGMVFQVFSLGANGKYKGQARVETVTNNVSSALLITPVQGTTIGQGDRVSTRL
jgi:predicted RNase H-like nuclease (RuvC/YqgF family)